MDFQGLKIEYLSQVKFVMKEIYRAEMSFGSRLYINYWIKPQN